MTRRCKRRKTTMTDAQQMLRDLEPSLGPSLRPMYHRMRGEFKGSQYGRAWSSDMLSAVHHFQIVQGNYNDGVLSEVRKSSERRVIEIIFRLPRTVQVSPQLTRLVMRVTVDYPFIRPEYYIESRAAITPHAQAIAQTLSRTAVPPEIVAHIAKNYLFEWAWGQRTTLKHFAYSVAAAKDRPLDLDHPRMRLPQRPSGPPPLKMIHDYEAHFPSAGWAPGAQGLPEEWTAILEFLASVGRRS